MKTRRDKYDVLFSRLVRERAGWSCERCDRYFPEDESRQALHCSHFFSRRNRSTRFHPMNACAHCFACHQRLGENPLLFQRWVNDLLGRGGYQKLWRTAHKTRKFSKGELEDLYSEMKSELKRMQELRAQGENGRIEFSLPTAEAS